MTRPGWRSWSVAAAIAADTFVAAVPGLHAYRVPGAAAVVAAAAGGSALVGFAATRVLRLRSTWSYLTSLSGLIIVLFAADGPHPALIVTAFLQGPSRLLSETLPLSGSRAQLTPLVVLVWVSGAAATEIVGRGRGPRAALVLPTGLYVLCFAVASGAPGLDRAAGPSLLVLLAVTAVLVSHTGAGYRAVTGALAGTAVLAVALALSLPSVPRLSASPAAVRRPAHVLSPTLTDPLAAMALLRDGAPHDRSRPEMTVTLTRPSNGYLALAVLDGYDGSQWRFSSDFAPTGGRIPGRPPALTPSVTERIDIVGSLPVPLLAAIDRPSSIDGVAAAADPTSGMLLSQSPNPRPRYTVVSDAPVATLAELPSADAIDAGAGAVADLGLPPDTSSAVAAETRFISESTGTGPPSPTVAYLQAVLHAVHTLDRRVDPSLAVGKLPGNPGVSAGTALSLVIDAVTVERTATPEQFATFFAVLARGLGVPARVVTGFRLVPSSAGGPLGAGTFVVVDRQAWAWTEVPISGLGWVVCDPTPDASSAAVLPPPPAEGTATTVPPRPAAAVARSGYAGGHPLAPPVRALRPARHDPAIWPEVATGVGAGVAGLAAAAPGSAFYRRHRRGRRRRSGEPRAQAVGAWLHVLDELERAGLRPDPAATSSEVAAEVGHHFGGELVARTRAVGAVADQALFSTGGELSQVEVAAAWERAEALGRTVLEGLDRRQRLRAAMVVGSTPLRAAAVT